MPFIQQQLTANGTTADGRVVVPKAILEIITNDQVITMAVGTTAGTGYAVGDTFELSTGTSVALNTDNFTAKGRVTAVSTGFVTGVEIISAGAYTVDPTLTNGGTTVLTGAGDGALTVTVTMQTARWTQDVSDYTNLTTNHEWVCTSVKASNAPTVGMQSILSGSNDSMRLLTASGYDVGSTWLTQPGAPPTNEFYVNLPNQDPEIFVSVTERRVNILVTDDGRNQKQYGGVGLFIPYTDVAGNYPFPGFIHGQSRTARAFTESYSTTLNAGVVWPIDVGASNVGPYQYRNNLSTEWFGISDNNNVGNDVTKAQLWPAQTSDATWSFTHAPVPAGSGQSAANMNPFASTQNSGSLVEDNTQAWFDVADSTLASQGPAPLGTGAQLHFTVRPHIISNQTDDVQVVGYIDGWEAVHGQGLAAFEEIDTESGLRYLVFNDTDSTALNWWVAMEII